MTSVIRNVLAAMVGLVFIAPASAQRIDLRPKFEEGQEFAYRLVQDAEQSFGQASTSTKMHQEIDLRFTVVSVDPESRAATLDVAFDRMKIEADAAGTTFTFDSADPDSSGGLGGLLAPLAELELTVEIDADGNITSIDGFDGVIPPGPGGDSLRGIVGPDMLGARFGPILTLKKGDGRASRGESWTSVDRFESSPFGPFEIVTEHELTIYRRSVATIETSGRLILDSEAGDANPKLRHFDYSGEYEWDTRRGMLKRMSVEQSGEIEMTYADQTGVLKTVSSFSVEPLD